MSLELFFDAPNQKDKEFDLLAEVHAAMEILFDVRKSAPAGVRFIATKLLEILYDLEDLHFDDSGRVPDFLSARREKAVGLAESIRDELSGPTLYGDQLAEAAGQVFPHKTK